MNHVGNVQLVGKEHAIDGLEVGGEGAFTVFDSEFETLDGVADDVVEVDLFGRDGEFLARHFGALEECLDKNAHAAVFVADDVDEVAAGGGIAGDGVVLEHFAGEADGGDGGFDFVRHVVDEVGFHLVQSVLGEDSADG